MFLTVFVQVIILFILIALGFLLAKTGILTAEGTRCCTDIALLVVTPCIIIKSFIRKFDPKTLKNLLLGFLIAFLSFIVIILLSHLIFRGKSNSRIPVLRFGAVFSNCGFMSIPLQQALLGDIGVFYSASYIAVLNLFAWSYGVIMLSGNRRQLSVKRAVLNPGIIGLIIGIIIYIFSIPLPDVIEQSLSYISALNTPLPMIIIGYHLAQSDILGSLRDFRCIFAVAVRLVFFPAVTLAGMYFCNIRGDLLVSVVISCSAPAAALTTMLSAKFGGDVSLSANIVSLSTLFSVITMPLIISIAKLIA